MRAGKTGTRLVLVVSADPLVIEAADTATAHPAVPASPGLGQVEFRPTAPETLPGTDPGPADYVVLDHDLLLRDAQEDRGRALESFHQLAGRCSRRGTPVALLYSPAEDNGILMAAFGRAAEVDPVLEKPFSPAERARAVDALFRVVAERIRNHHVEAKEHLDHEIGALFKIPRSAGGEMSAAAFAAAYDRSRNRALAGMSMGGFTAELRQNLAELLRYPLPDLPFDPRNTQPHAVSLARDTRTLGQLSDGEAYNLRDLLTVPESNPAQMLLYDKPGIGGRPNANAEQRAGSWRRNPPCLLLTGESGTGKTMVAQFIHTILTAAQKEGRQRDGSGPYFKGSFVRVNCAGLTAENLTHELMGSVAGEYTGISHAVPGSLVQGTRGVVFLDEFGELSDAAQRAMLAFLDDRLIRPQVSGTPIYGFSHIIAATNRDLEEMVGEGAFRHDLLARFRMRAHIPPLRERADELETLIDFVARDPGANPLLPGGEHTVTHISFTARTALLGHNYGDGNFRELEEIIHGGLRRARTRHSRILQHKDLKFSESVFYPDKLRGSVTSARVPETAGLRLVEIPNIREIRRIGRMLSEPLVIDPNKDGWVLGAGAAYVNRDITAKAVASARTAEIERKFLLPGAVLSEDGATVSADGTHVPVSGTVSIRQGYLSRAGDTTEFRLREIDGTLWLFTLKIRRQKAAAADIREEREFELTQADFDRLWSLTDGARLSKRRLNVRLDDGLEASVDLYEGSLSGAATVEVEFDDFGLAEAFIPPAWFGPEVTGDPEWSNRGLAGSSRVPDPQGPGVTG